MDQFLDETGNQDDANSQLVCKSTI